VKLAVLGGGGVRMPAFVRAVLSASGAGPVGSGALFDRITLFEPDRLRRETMCRLAETAAGALQGGAAVQATTDIEEALSGADFVFSAMRVGGDRARVIDERVALRRGLVGQETTGAGGAAMALRTIPVVLAYSHVLERCAPGAVLINFTNPAGTITQAISSHSDVRVFGVCDTPSAAVDSLVGFFGVERSRVGYSYAGLNHLGWVTSFLIDGEERMEEILRRYEELQHFDDAFAALDAAVVRRVGAVPTEYLFYYYDSQRYVGNIGVAGTSRGEDVLRMNQELLANVGGALHRGDTAGAWSAYTSGLGLRQGTYMAVDTGFRRELRSAAGAAGPAGRAHLGGYEAVALSIINGLGSAEVSEVIVNTRNGSSLEFLDQDDIVEVPALVSDRGVAPKTSGALARSAVGLVCQVKEYERALIDAAVSGDAGLAAVALSMHPLVPGVSAARDLLDDYRREHGEHLAYLR